MKGFRDHSQISVNLVSQVIPRDNRELEDGVRKLWDLETLGIREENEIHEGLKDGISFNGERYEVSLPWKEGHGPLPNNYRNSLKRPKGQIERLQNEPDVLRAYDAVIKEQAALGVVERVPELGTAEKIHYLPHHAVIRKDAKTTKLRVVYDASSKEGKNGVSLNDCLHVGPTLSPLLYEILIRFRQKRIALVGDIEKAFLNIEVKLRDRDCLRFLWVENVDRDHADPVVYRFCRVVFGVNCSPFLLNATLQYHLDTFVEIDSEFVRVMKRSFYVDDLVTGEKATQEAIELYDKAKTRLGLGGFKLRKWLTNSEQLRAEIEQQESRDGPNTNKRIENADESYAKEMLGLKEESKCERVLGLSWNCDKDLFVFELVGSTSRADGLPVTKRSILKVVAGMYDPLRIISPVVVSIKVLFTCCVTRAVHLDLVTDMTASTFIRCLRRFAARRGTPALIVSDNAKTFKASEKLLRQLHENREVREHLESNRIDWRFNLERAPWWGGFYERLIGTAKRCLRKVLGNARLNVDELLTVLMELEATLNSRPLTYDYDELGTEMLTPSHLIYGRRLLSLPEMRNDEEESETALLRRFRYLAKLRIHFWNRWRREYLTDLREHHRGKKESQNKVSIGDVVLIHEDNTKRSNWKMGKVVEQIVGKDGVVRGAKLRLITKGKPIIVNRAVQKLYPLEVSSALKEVSENESGQRNANSVGNAGKQVISRREIPRRAAALDSRWKTQAMPDH